MIQSAGPIFTAVLFSVLLVLIAVLGQRFERLVRSLQLQIEELDRATHIKLPGQEFSAAYWSGCDCSACHHAEPWRPSKTSSSPLESAWVPSDTSQYRMGCRCASCVARHEAVHGAVESLLHGVSATEVSSVLPEDDGPVGEVPPPGVSPTALRIHLRGSDYPCTDPWCRRPHRLIDGPVS